MSATIIDLCKQLKLSTVATHLPHTLKVAQDDNWTYEQFVEHLFQQELDRRCQRRVEQKIRLAKLPIKPTLDLFDFDFHASRKEYRGKILALMELDFVKNHSDVIFIGNPGVGKTHLSCCVGYRAAQNDIKTLFTTAAEMINRLIESQANNTLMKKLKYYQDPELLICDEIGYLPLEKQGANLFFQVISERHQKKSTMITTNLPFQQWGSVFESTSLATAIVDRLVMKSEVLVLEGDSYRRVKRK